MEAGNPKAYKFPSAKQLKLNARADIQPYLVQLNAIEDLEEVHLGGHTLGVEACVALAEVLNTKKTLKIADLADIFTGRLITEIPPALQGVCDSLIDHTNLVELDLSDNAFGGRSAEPMVQLLTNNHNLQVLKLANNGLGVTGGRIVADALYAGAQLAREKGVPSNLRTVICGRNRLEDGSAPNWARAFEAHGNLREVRLHQNGIRMSGIQTICQALSSSAELETLDLNDNCAVLQGSNALAAALPHWTKLKVLNIGDLVLRGRGGMLIVEALAQGHNGDLQELLLGNNELSREVLGRLAQVISSCLPKLQTLDIDANYADEDDECIQALKEAMEANGYGDGLLGVEDLDPDGEEEACDEDGLEDDEIDDGENADQDDEGIETSISANTPTRGRNDTSAEPAGEGEGSVDALGSSLAAFGLASNTNSKVFRIPPKPQHHFNTKESVLPYVAELKDVPDVEEVHFGGHTFGVDASLAVAEVLKDLKSLKVADFADIFTTRLVTEIPLSLTALCDAMVHLENLREVNFSDNAFGGRSSQPLVNLLTNNHNIEVLKLSNNGLGPQGGRIIATALADGARAAKELGVPRKLHTIVCGRNRLENFSADAWAAAIEAHPNLRELHMFQNGIRMDGFEKLCRALSHCSSLQVVNLLDNTATYRGSAALAASLPSWPDLRVLNVGDCLLRMRGGNLVLDALAASSSPLLEELHFQGNEVNTTTLGRLADIIEAQLPKLKLCDIEANWADEEDKSIERLQQVMSARGHENGLRGADDLDPDGEEPEDMEEGEEDSEEEGDPEPEVEGEDVRVLSNEVAALSVESPAAATTSQESEVAAQPEANGVIVAPAAPTHDVSTEHLSPNAFIAGVGAFAAYYVDEDTQATRGTSAYPSTDSKLESVANDAHESAAAKEGGIPTLAPNPASSSSELEPASTSESLEVSDMVAAASQPDETTVTSSERKESARSEAIEDLAPTPLEDSAPAKAIEDSAEADAVGDSEPDASVQKSKTQGQHVETDVDKVSVEAPFQEEAPPSKGEAIAAAIAAPTLTADVALTGAAAAANEVINDAGEALQSAKESANASEEQRQSQISETSSHDDATTAESDSTATDDSPAPLSEAIAAAVVLPAVSAERVVTGAANATNEIIDEAGEALQTAKQNVKQQEEERASRVQTREAAEGDESSSVVAETIAAPLTTAASVVVGAKSIASDLADSASSAAQHATDSARSTAVNIASHVVDPASHAASAVAEIIIPSAGTHGDAETTTVPEGNSKEHERKEETSEAVVEQPPAPAAQYERAAGPQSVVDALESRTDALGDGAADVSDGKQEVSDKAIDAAANTIAGSAQEDTATPIAAQHVSIADVQPIFKSESKSKGKGQRHSRGRSVDLSGELFVPEDIRSGSGSGRGATDGQTSASPSPPPPKGRFSAAMGAVWELLR